MPDIKDINPVGPVWPKRPVRDVVQHKERRGGEQRKDGSEGDGREENPGDHEIDEYA